MNISEFPVKDSMILDSLDALNFSAKAIIGANAPYHTICQKSDGNIYRIQMIAVSIVAAIFVTITSVVVGWRITGLVREDDKEKRLNYVPGPHDAHEVFEALLDHHSIYRPLSPVTMRHRNNSSSQRRRAPDEQTNRTSLSSRHTNGLYKVPKLNDSESNVSANGYEGISVGSTYTQYRRYETYKAELERTIDNQDNSASKSVSEHQSPVLTTQGNSKLSNSA